MRNKHVIQGKDVKRTDKFQLLKLERKNRGVRVSDALYFTLPFSLKIRTGNRLPIDIQGNRNVEVREVVGQRDSELLISTISLLVLTKGTLGDLGDTHLPGLTCYKHRY
jgi:hypothetical protein